MKKPVTQKMQAIDRAVLCYTAIKEASVSPEKCILGEDLEIYRELVDWGFIEKYNILDISNQWLYIAIIAMHLSKDFADVKESGSVEKEKSKKWEIIQKALLTLPQ